MIPYPVILFPKIRLWHHFQCMKANVELEAAAFQKGEAEGYALAAESLLKHGNRFLALNAYVGGDETYSRAVRVDIERAKIVLAAYREMQRASDPFRREVELQLEEMLSDEPTEEEATYICEELLEMYNRALELDERLEPLVKAPSIQDVLVGYIGGVFTDEVAIRRLRILQMKTAFYALEYLRELDVPE